jgi:hypothetical protein
MAEDREICFLQGWAGSLQSLAGAAEEEEEEEKCRQLSKILWRGSERGSQAHI